ncbi:hypothetical protein DUI87_05158 [Hirundo rustica rustica]|uniref:Uncharacterized protein n=1 Tax=Hirundo rustica rustica TaxID=333673 RepID=A0A3M0LEC1_HIRRU|nr:hypothetical protein DUI87_05158 [Hirundo rustica rustica]
MAMAVAARTGLSGRSAGADAGLARCPRRSPRRRVPERSLLSPFPPDRPRLELPVHPDPHRVYFRAALLLTWKPIPLSVPENWKLKLPKKSKEN